jgi:hypothetical protein
MADAGNIEAAEIIATHPDEYGGPESSLCLWAQIILRKARERAEPEQFELIEKE